MNKPRKRKKGDERGMRIVALGGGTGLSALLRGLKEACGASQRRQHCTKQRPISDIAAIVTVTDDGGSSGRLRRENRMLPPGDIRNCMVALAKDEALLSRLFQYRFHAGRGLPGPQFRQFIFDGAYACHRRFCRGGPRFREGVGHSRANLSIDCVEREFDRDTGQRQTRARRNENITNPVAHCETGIGSTPGKSGTSQSCGEAIPEADLILMGPGSLYTSVIPNLLIPEIAQAVVRSRAPRVYVANLMTQPGETTNFALSEHIRAIDAHVGKHVIDYVVANRKTVSPEVASRYHAQGAEQVEVDRDKISRMKVPKLLLDNLLEEHGVIRHNSPKAG